ncbi:MAG: hypothetical protein DIZ78_09545 [endosymbiont of Escarpia spicata]|uniref:Uncharacterized protein n=1 Tax=endosymbiont of Escarpia spicata TaxID=2200908 RepID=A0A370DNA1_9GAMM|nr:MAG: hypothetical protein DIZ78_09545 [endosymbiont of Escarpia spicata]
MDNLDLIDQINFDRAKSSIKAILDSTDNEIRLAVCRDITIDQISATIEKFPLRTQKEILAMLADKYLTKWAI